MSGAPVLDEILGRRTQIREAILWSEWAKENHSSVGEKESLEKPSSRGTGRESEMDLKTKDLKRWSKRALDTEPRWPLEAERYFEGLMDLSH